MTALYDWKDYAAPCSEETCSGKCIAGMCEPLPDITLRVYKAREPLSLASQVVYQCRVLDLLRETGDLSLLRDPVRLQAAYRAKYGE